MQPIYFGKCTRPRAPQAKRMKRARHFDRADIDGINRADELWRWLTVGLLLGAAGFAVLTIGQIDAALLGVR